MSIIHWNNETDGELSETNMQNKLEAMGYSVNKYIYPPGTCFPDHSHNVDKIDAVLAGQFKMTLEGQSVILQAGDCIAVPRGAVHSAAVIGNESVISLDAIRH